jgi:hypothetical protein
MRRLQSAWTCILVYPFTTPSLLVVFVILVIVIVVCACHISFPVLTLHLYFRYFISLFVSFEVISYKWMWYLMWTVMTPLCMTNNTNVTQKNWIWTNLKMQCLTHSSVSWLMFEVGYKKGQPQLMEEGWPLLSQARAFWTMHILQLEHCPYQHEQETNRLYINVFTQECRNDPHRCDQNYLQPPLSLFTLFRMQEQWLSNFPLNASECHIPSFHRKQAIHRWPMVSFYWFLTLTTLQQEMSWLNPFD